MKVKSFALGVLLMMLLTSFSSFIYAQDGTQYNEDNALTTVNTTTTSNVNQNTNSNTNNNTSVSTAQNTNINTSTSSAVNTNNNTSVNTNNNNSVSSSTAVSTNTNNNNNFSQSTSTSTVNSTVNQTVNNNNVSSSESVSQNTNINQNTSVSESNVQTNNVNQNNSVSSNTNRNINQSSSTQTIRQEIKSEAPPASAIAPSIMSYSQDLCTTGVSGAFQGQVFGLSGGKTVRDMNCERLKLSQMLYNQGMKVASIALMAQDERVFRALWEAGTYPPYEGKIGEEAKKLWLANPHKRPDKEYVEKEFIESCLQEHNPKRDKIQNDVVGLFSKVVVSKTKSEKQCKKELYGG